MPVATRATSLEPAASGAFERRDGGGDIAAEGGKADIAKPMRGLGSGVFEIALPFHGDAFRVVYAVQLGEEMERLPA